MSADERRVSAKAIRRHLAGAPGAVQGRTVGLCWPLRGAPNLRSWMEQIHDRGAQCALPVVVGRHAPHVFRTWRRGAAMASVICTIAVPANGIDVLPNIVESPVVGFDPTGYRLGYGGRFYHRTFVAMARGPLLIGVGFASRSSQRSIRWRTTSPCGSSSPNTGAVPDSNNGLGANASGLPFLRLPMVNTPG